MISLKRFYQLNRRLSLAIINTSSKQQMFRCFHQQCVHQQHSLLHHQKQVLFSQVRTINIAGEDSLEKARRPNWQQRNDQQQQQQQNERSSKRRSPLAYMFALLPVATFCLGTWQIYRLQWKLDLIAKLEHLVKSPAVEFPEDLTNLQELEYLKVRLTGYFDSKSAPVFIFPRPLLKEISSSSSKQPESGGLFSRSQSHHIGAQMVLPFVVTESRLVEAYNQLLLDSGREDLLINNNNNSGGGKAPMRILVNVGWVSRETMDQVNRSYYGTKSSSSSSNYQQEIELIGVIRKTEKREPFTAKKDGGAGYVSRRDISKLADQLDTTPIFLDAYQSYPISLSYFGETIRPVGAQTRVALRNEHLSYIVTWYSLTAILAYLWFKKIFKRRL